MQGEQVLITGGAGFIGSFIADELLAKGHRVRVLDNLTPQVHGGRETPPEYLSKEVEFVRGDVRDAAALDRALAGVDVVFHQAAVVGVGQSMYEIRDYTETNTLGTATLLQVLVDKHRDHVRKLITASSMSIYGEGEYVDPETGAAVRPVGRGAAEMEAGEWDLRVPGTDRAAKPVGTPEEKPLEPASIYAINKRDQEEMTLVTGEAYGIPAVALRYFNTYGTRQALSNPYTGVAAIFCSCYLNGNRPVIFEDGLQSRDFVHVRDIARANVMAMEREEANGQAINVGTGRPINILQVAQLLLKSMKPEAADDPAVQPQVLGRYRPGDTRHCYGNIAKARELLGYEPTVPYEQGLEELIEWVRTQTAEDKTRQMMAELRGRRLVEE